MSPGRRSLLKAGAASGALLVARPLAAIATASCRSPSTSTAGPAWWGKHLGVQVLQSRGDVPAVVHAEEVVVPTDREPVLRIRVPVSGDDGGWLLLRVTDPDAPVDPRAPAPFDGFGGAVAYASPWFLAP
jgi:hypothetical protein